MKNFLSKYGFHLIAVLLFLIISGIYFKPAYDGYALRQHDMEQFYGMSREIVDYQKIDGQSPLWTNSMFSGMPSAQIYVAQPGNYFKTMLNGAVKLLKSPVCYLFLYLLGFYIFGLCVGLNRWVTLIGAVAFAFSSYNIVILQAGHITKAMAIAFVLPTIGGFLLAYRRNIKWGTIVFGIALAFQLSANHLQITYYSIFLFLGLGIYFLVRAFLKKELKHFALASAGLIAVALIAVIINLGNIKITKDYAKYTIRGGNDLTLNADGTPIDKSNENGLDLDYITNWSYGIGETFTLVSPYVKGNASETFGNSPFESIVENGDFPAETQQFLQNYPTYWGNQPFTSGPVYFGAIVVFLAFLSLFFLKSRIKWAYFGVALLTILLSWGKNFMGFSELFIHHFPGYNKFRAVTIILAITSVIFPVLAALILDQFIKERENLKSQLKRFYMVAGGFICFLLILKFVGLGDNFTSNMDRQQFSEAAVRANVMNQINRMSPEQLAKNGIDKNNSAQMNQIVQAQIQSATQNFSSVKQARKAIFDSSMNRTLLFVLLGAVLLFLFFKTEINYKFIVLGLGVLMAIDLIGVDLNYLNNDEDDSGNYKYWMSKADYLYPEIATQGDLDVMKMETQENPSLKPILAKASKAGENEAEDLGFDESMQIKKVEEYEEFRALNRHTNYRVLDLSTNPFNSSRASYFHKSIGGYHGAKLRNYQNLIDFYFTNSINPKIMEMLNTKYIIQQNGQTAKNPTALGDAWLIRQVKTFDTPDEEIRALGNSYKIAPKTPAKLLVNGKEVPSATVSGREKIQLLVQNDSIDVQIPQSLQQSLSAGLDGNIEAVYVMDVHKQTNFVPKQVLAHDSLNSFLQLMDLSVGYNFEPSTDAVMLKSEAKKLSASTYSGMGTIKRTKYHPTDLKYEFNSDSKQFAVFSEIYYPDGWKAYVDGKEVSIVKTNYLLRGVEIPAGKHQVEMKYVYPFYHTANLMSSVGCGIFFLLIAMGIWTDRKKVKS